MTPILHEEESKAARLKHKLMNDGQSKEETRSFLSFSRGNLSISHSDMEHGIGKHRLRFRRNTILSTTALIVALLCLGLETWSVHCSLANAREIGQLKINVENLMRRIGEGDFLEGLEALDEQLYAEESVEEDDADEADIDNADYDTNYDNVSSGHDYYEDYHTPAYGMRPSDFPDASSTLKPVPSPPDPTLMPGLLDYFAFIKRAKPKRGLDQNKTRGEGRKNSEQVSQSHEEKIEKEKSTQHRRDVRDLGRVSLRNKLKRSVSDRSEEFTLAHRRGNRTQRRRMILSRPRPHENVEDDSSERNQTGWERHPPKKYYAHAHPDSSHSGHQDDSAGQLGRTSKNLEDALTEHQEDVRGQVVDLRKALQISESPSKHVRRGMSRRHLRTPRQVHAIHYGADSTLFSEEDEHTGNGRARHGDGIFKAWRASDWVSELGMNKYFSLANDGRLTVQEAGLYLTYAQIHYLDEHDENGFHLLVNGRPILQCMLYSPGVGHKSRSCFSAQVTLLHAGDVIVLKDVGSARYTLFQQDKSFFGLVKLGEARQQRHSTQPPVHQ